MAVIKLPKLRPPSNGLHAGTPSPPAWMSAPYWRKRNKALGDWCRDITIASCPTFTDHAVKKVALNESVGSQGGYLVPDDVLVSIDAILRSVGIFHTNAWLQQMNSATMRIPSVKITQSHATGDNPLLGGMTVTWTQEGATITESEPNLQQNLLTANELAATVFAANPLVDDGGEALGDFLQVLFAYAIEWTVERACFQGIGTTRPVGVAISSSTATVNRQTASTVTQQDCANMVAALLPECYGRAIWAASPTAVAKIIQTTGFQSNGFYVPAEGSRLVGYLLGAPLYVTQHLPQVGGGTLTQGDVVLFDPKLYILGFRELEIASDRHTRFQQNQTVFRLLWRGDGQPIPEGTVTLADGATTTCGAFVALK